MESSSITTLFLIDSDVLIDAKRDYYPFNSVPEFWNWLEYQGRIGKVKIPKEIADEIKAGNDELTEWIKSGEIKEALIIDEDLGELVQKVFDEGFADDLTDLEIGSIGKDAFLIAYALNSNPVANRCVVTTEVSKPSAIRANRKVPDVCDSLGIQCCSAFNFYQLLEFSTDWESQLIDI